MFELLERQFSAIVMAACLTVGGCAEFIGAEKGPIPPGEYVILANDDLSNIAIRAYGDIDLWHALLNANPQLAKRPNFTLEVGETIIIPFREELDTSLPKSIFPKALPADYIVLPGDSLHFIAQGCYGDRELWPLIFEANRSTLSERVKEDTRQLIAGQVLHIPARESRARGSQTQDATESVASGK